jgi:hypothetical protein
MHAGVIAEAHLAGAACGIPITAALRVEVLQRCRRELRVPAPAPVMACTGSDHNTRVCIGALTMRAPHVAAPAHPACGKRCAAAHRAHCAASMEDVSGSAADVRSVNCCVHRVQASPGLHVVPRSPDVVYAWSGVHAETPQMGRR